MEKFVRKILMETTVFRQRDNTIKNMQFDGAVITEQGITFAIVVVKSNVLDQSTKREETRAGFSYVFPNMPIILMAQNSRGIPTYSGRTDIVKFLTKVHPSRIPFKKYSLN